MGILLLRSTSSVLILAISNAFHDATSERYYYYDAVQEARLQREHGGYYVVANITETYGIDCFDNASRLQCFASMVNSPYKCYNVVRKITPRANVQKSIATVNGRNIFGLVADRDIPAFTEILVNYGPAYIYPT